MGWVKKYAILEREADGSMDMIDSFYAMKSSQSDLCPRNTNVVE